jgi:tRNA(Ile)-lysidine synthase
MSARPAKAVHPLQERVVSFIEEACLLGKDEKLLVGVSGGPDSMVLLDLLERLAPAWRIELHVAHLHHGIRGRDADRDMEFVRNYCRRHGLRFHSGRVDVRARASRERLSIEEAARKARYRFFQRVAARKRIGKVALGHNADDQVETFLMRLLRGAGGRGLSGMAPMRREGAMTIIRPLLHTWRAEILRYAGDRDVRFRIDRSNRNTRFLRNKLRHNLIRHLERSYNPNVKEVLKRSAEILKAEHDFLEERVAGMYPDIVQVRRDEVAIALKRFNAQPEAVASELLRRAVNELNPAGVLGYEDRKAVIRLCRRERGRKVHFLPGGVAATKEYARIVLRRAKREKFGPYEFPFSDGLEVRCDPSVLRFRVSIIPAKGLRRLAQPPRKLAEVWSVEGGRHWPLVENFSWDKIGNGKLSVRNRRRGDRYRPLGMDGEKKIKRVMIDEKLPLRLRGRVPILTCADDIVWLVGYRIAESYRIVPSTRRALQVRVEKIGGM